METKKVNELLKRIEEERRLLNNFSLAESLVALQVIAQSQRLDKLLNEYYRCRNC